MPDLRKLREFEFQGEPQRLDLFLHSQLVNFSRERIKKLIKSGRVYINTQRVFKPGIRLRPEDKITVEVEEIYREEKIIPQPLPVDIIYEDDDILVVNKPPGIITHPTAVDRTGTLANALLYHCKTLSDVYGPLKPGIVHRLDKDTSGILIVAKNNSAHMNLCRQFMNREVVKKYLAVVEGRIEADSGRIHQPIARGKLERKKMKIDYSRGKPAETIFRVLARVPENDCTRVRGLHSYSFVILYPRTGRTHQLRVHMKYMGHPIVGDTRYSKRSKLIARQALHAYSLKFQHPRTGKVMELFAPLPQDFNTLLAKIGITNQEKLLSSI